jgi:hypothetical protein
VLNKCQLETTDKLPVGKLLNSRVLISSSVQRGQAFEGTGICNQVREDSKPLTAPSTGRTNGKVTAVAGGVAQW